MQIAVNCKKHQAYQYGAFHEAFIHIGMYSGHCRKSDDSSLRTKLSYAPRRLGVIRHGYMSSKMVTSLLPIHMRIFRLITQFCMVLFLFGIARARGVDIWCSGVIFALRGARCRGTGLQAWRSREFQRGGIWIRFGCCVLAKSQHFIPDPPAEREQCSRNYFLHNMKNITKPQVRFRRESSARL
jgi:hypothetical protein